MKAPTTREERKLRDADFALRLAPRMFWHSQTAGTYYRTTTKQREQYSGACDPELTHERQKRIRRRRNRALRGWMPYAQR
jgi:hypothetical protein